MTHFAVTLAAVNFQGMWVIKVHGAQPSAHPAHRLEVVLSGLDTTDRGKDISGPSFLLVLLKQLSS